MKVRIRPLSECLDEWERAKSARYKVWMSGVAVIVAGVVSYLRLPSPENNLAALAFVGLFPLFVLRTLEEIRNKLDYYEARERFSKLDCIVDDKRWQGSRSEEAFHVRSKGALQQIVGKTANGAWFVYSCRDESVKPITEQEAKLVLSSDRAFYAQYFGEPLLA